MLEGADASLTRERGIERGARRLEVHRAHELARLLGAGLAVHADVLPLHRQRTIVLDRVQLADDLLEVDPAAAERAELPRAIRMAEREMATEHARPLRHVRPPHVLHVDVIDAVAERRDERGVVDALIAEVARV